MMWHKHKGTIMLVLVIVLALVAPLVYFSSFGQGKVAEWVSNNKGSESAPEWQMRIGRTHLYLGRNDEATKAFENYLKYWPYDHDTPDNPRNAGYREAYFMLAVSLEEEGKRDDALQKYQDYCDWWPDAPKYRDATEGTIRCKRWR